MEVLRQNIPQNQVIFRFVYFIFVGVHFKGRALRLDEERVAA